MPQPLRPNFIEVESYREESDPELTDNQLALVFPPPESDEAVFDALFKAPACRPEDFTSWPLVRRLEYLERLDEFHYVFQMEIALLNKCVALLRKSYRERNTKHPRVLNAIYRILSGMEVKTPRICETGAGGGLGLLLTSISGLGKTSFLDRLVAYLGDYGRIHLSLNGKPARWPQLGVIRVAAMTTWADTLVRILGEIDRQLGRDYYMKRARALSAKQLELSVIQALTTGFAPLLIIDEFQRIARLSEMAALKILQGLIDLMEVWGVPLIVAGTVRIRRVADMYPSEMSKFTTGPFSFEPLELDDPDTSNFLLLLKEHSVSLSPIRYSDDFDERFLAQTMGIRRFMREYMKAVLTRHANDERVVADGELLRQIATKELSHLERALSVLRRARLGMTLRYDELQLYEDFLPEDTRRSNQSPAQVRTETAWRNIHKSGRGGSLNTVEASDFLHLKGVHDSEESSVKAGEGRAGADVVQVQSEEKARPRTNARKHGRGEKASKAIKGISAAVPIGQIRPPKPLELDGDDPGDIS